MQILRYLHLLRSLGEQCIEARDGGKRYVYLQIYLIDGIDRFKGT
jgi:hypothetical protein